MQRKIGWILLMVVVIFFISIPVVRWINSRSTHYPPPPLVMIDDVLYQRGGAAPKTPQEPFDGTIVSCTDYNEIPAEHLQTNFAHIHNEPYVFVDGTLLIRGQDGVWYIWKPSQTQPS